MPDEIVDSYKLLQSWSENARYLMATFDIAFVRTQLLGELRAVLALVGLDY